MSVDEPGVITRVEIEPGSLRRLLQASKTWDTVAKTTMRQNLRAAAEGAANAAKSSVRGLPAKTNTGLREQLAGGVKVSLSGGRMSGETIKGEGVRIVAGDGGLPPGKKPMVAASMAAQFRHPVFGHQGVYVTQQGHDWFRGALRGHVEEYRAAIVAAIEEASKLI